MVARMNLTDTGATFSALAQETISGGQLVKAVSGATVLTTTNALDNVIEIMLADAVGDGTTTVGVALTTGVSGDRVTVQTNGIHGFYAADAIAAGADVMAQTVVASADAVTDAVFVAGSKTIGHVLSTGASGQLVLVKLTL